MHTMALDLTTPAEAISEATTLFEGLIDGLPALPVFPEPPEIDIEDVGTLPTDLTETIEAPTVEELTEGAAGGVGVFDKIMSSLNAHIESQYHKQIISKSDVASIYVAAIQATLPQAVNFLLVGQESYWRAKLVQIQAQNMWIERARLNAELQTAKLIAFKAQADAATAQVNALTAQTTFANQKLQLVATIQSINSAETTEAIAQANYDLAYAQTHDLLPGGGAPGGMVSKDLDLKDEQIELAQKQQLLLDAQTNVQRAQTYDTNTDLTPVAGIIGVQKNLYTEQISSYVKDAENKGVKLVADLFTSMKALDDSVQSPGPVSGNLMMALNKYMNNLELPNAMVSADTPATGVPSDDSDWDEPGQQP
jgi:hypothetical protein